MDAELAAKRLAHFDAARAAVAINWLCELSKTPKFSVEQMRARLKDGHILCSAANRLQADACPKVNSKSHPSPITEQPVKYFDQPSPAASISRPASAAVVSRAASPPPSSASYGSAPHRPGLPSAPASTVRGGGGGPSTQPPPPVVAAPAGGRSGTRSASAARAATGASTL